MKPSRFGPEFFVETALMIDRDGGLDGLRGAAFAGAVAARAIYAERRDGDGALAADPSNPGYLHRKVAGRDVFVPFNLVVAFPGADVLADAISLAEAVRLGYGHPICLSGSATFLGRLGKAADLDFCEYYPSASGTLAPAVQGKACSGVSPYLVCVKCARTDISLPAVDLESRLKELLGQGTPGTAPSVKMDFVGVSPRFGTVPVTSVVLPVHPSSIDAGAARASFAYQEAVICVTSPPRTLLRAEEFARYLLWLREEGARWLDDGHAGETKAPLKSLKRTLSAFLLMGYDLPGDEITLLADAFPEALDGGSPVDYILSSLNDGTLARVADDLRFAELRALAPRGHGVVPTDVVEDIHLHEPLGQELVALALGAARELAEGLVDYIDDLFERVGVGLA